MALIVPGKTLCPLCGAVLAREAATVAFPAFLGVDHELRIFSDCALHRECFLRDPRHDQVVETYARYRAIWDARPRHLQTMEEIEAWGRDAFKEFAGASRK